MFLILILDVLFDLLYQILTSLILCIHFNYLLIKCLNLLQMLFLLWYILRFLNFLFESFFLLLQQTNFLLIVGEIGVCGFCVIINGFLFLKNAFDILFKLFIIIILIVLVSFSFYLVGEFFMLARSVFVFDLFFELMSTYLRVLF